MHQKHYHPYQPSVATNIMETYRAAGWTPPSERKDYQSKWHWYQTLGWTRNEPEPEVLQ